MAKPVTKKRTALARQAINLIDRVERLADRQRGGCTRNATATTLVEQAARAVAELLAEVLEQEWCCTIRGQSFGGVFWCVGEARLCAGCYRGSTNPNDAGL